MNRAAALLLAATFAILVWPQGVGRLAAQSSQLSLDTGDAREAFEAARAQQRNARLRAEKLEAETARADEAAVRARGKAAALAARVQQSEAGVAAAEAQLALVEHARDALSSNLAKRREPLVRLTAALENMVRRPLALAALQPGSLRDVVHTRAVLGSAIPVVRKRTASLRGELDRARALELERNEILAARRDAVLRLETRRRDMLAVAETERVLARQAAGGASREAARAIELAEEARDLDALLRGFEQSASQRARLASLEGPIARPSRPGAASLPQPAPTPAGRGSLAAYILPVTGRISAGFGEATADGSRRPGIMLETRPRAQVIAPGAGRIAFAGEYEGYGRIVIVEHEGGWTSLLTGLASLTVATGQEVAAGSPLGLSTSSGPAIGLELRRGGKPVNPLDRLR